MISKWELENIQASLGRFAIEMSNNKEYYGECSEETFAHDMLGAVAFVEFMKKEIAENED